jgi:Holliday junction resolvase RusA-like endonuclease
MARQAGKQIEIVFAGDPLTKSNDHKFFRGKVYIPKRIQNYEDNLGEHAKKCMRAQRVSLFKGLVKITIVYFYKTKRRKDLQNLPKTTCDALNGIVYKDDSQIHEMHLYKHLDRKNPRVCILIEEVSDASWESND